MAETSIPECFMNGAACLSDRVDSLETKDWNPHPSFKGVALKHLITGADTGGALSCHMVRVEPGCVLEEHVHDTQWELHEVVEGSGTALLRGGDTEYTPGIMAVIPNGEPHRVQAGEQGLILFAKFFPALV